MQEYIPDDDSLSSVAEPDMSAEYTAGDYMQWTFEGLYELIRGKVFKMSPAPSSKHQYISTVLTGNFYKILKTSPCTLYSAPFDVYLVKENENFKKGKNILQPDLVVVCDKNKITDFGCVGAPDLVVEIISPHSSTRDLKYKFSLYEEYGVKEYWIVFPAEKVIQIFNLHDGKYGVPKMFAASGMVKSTLFPELKVDMEEIFREI
jgi:Uma2 family endonuclease